MGVKAIGQLCGYTFKVPEYQRGYRWTKREVEILLEDLWKFFNSEHQQGEFYCLQPIVVKKDESNENTYILIDGQQRLTTIYLIFKYFKWDCFKIVYETRKQSEEFLKKVSFNGDMEEAKKNPDFFHIWKAYKTIRNWIDKKKKELVPSQMDEDTFNDLFKKLKKFRIREEKDISNNVRVIWYELHEDEEERGVFIRLNSGKIPLTDTELIRGYLLLKKHFEGDSEDLIRKKQLEIANEWDLINTQLQNNQFWYFISNKEYDTRMDLIFEILLDTKRDDRYSLFFKFLGEYEGKLKNNPEKVWMEIKEIYYTLLYWYENPTFYHLVGFLICVGKDIKQLYKKLKGKDKEESVKELKKLIKRELKIEISNQDEKKIKISNKSLKELSYNQDKSIIEKLLLFHNIATILNQKDTLYRFPFDVYKEEKWSLEHIHARNSENIREKDWEKWLKLNKNILEKIPNKEEKFNQLKRKIEGFLDDLRQSKLTKEEKRKQFEELQREVLTSLNKLNEDEIDSVGNLTLLSTKHNSALGNQTFAVKRAKIIEIDRKGGFIPPTTKNVFLKYYSDSINDPYFWTSEDSEAYLKDIRETIENFFKEIKNE